MYGGEMLCYCDYYSLYSSSFFWDLASSFIAVSAFLPKRTDSKVILTSWLSFAAIPSYTKNNFAKC